MPDNNDYISKIDGKYLLSRFAYSSKYDSKGNEIDASNYVTKSGDSTITGNLTISNDLYVTGTLHANITGTIEGEASSVKYPLLIKTPTNTSGYYFNGSAAVTIDLNTDLASFAKTSEVNSKLSSYLPISAGSSKSLTGDLYLGNHSIQNINSINFNTSVGDNSSEISVSNSSNLSAASDPILLLSLNNSRAIGFTDNTNYYRIIFGSGNYTYTLPNNTGTLITDQDNNYKNISSLNTKVTNIIAAVGENGEKAVLDTDIITTYPATDPGTAGNSKVISAKSVYDKINTLQNTVNSKANASDLENYLEKSRIVQEDKTSPETSDEDIKAYSVEAVDTLLSNADSKYVKYYSEDAHGSIQNIYSDAHFYGTLSADKLNVGSIEGTIEGSAASVAHSLYINETSGTQEFDGSKDITVDLTKYALASDIPEIPSNHVTTDTAQTISGNKTYSGTNTFNNNVVLGNLTVTKANNSSILKKKKNLGVISGQVYAKNGIVFGGTAAEAGLVTRGISGLGVPVENDDGSITAQQDHVYVNYVLNSSDYQYKLILGAGSTGTPYSYDSWGSTVPKIYAYTAVRGDQANQIYTLLNSKITSTTSTANNALSVANTAKSTANQNKADISKLSERLDSVAAGVENTYIYNTEAEANSALTAADKSKFKVGDKQIILAEGVPDRIITSISGGTIVATPIESKTQLDINTATSNVAGVVKLGDDTEIDSSEDKVYPVQLNANDQMFVNVPWEDTYEHPSYTSRSLGFYKVAVDNLGHVNNVEAVSKADITGLGIPGQDTKYTAKANSGLLLSGTEFSLNTTFTSDNGAKNYAVEEDSSGKLYVNVPWQNTDTNTSHTHSAGAGLSVSGSGGTSGAVSYSLKDMTASAIGGAKLFSDTVQSVAANAVSATASRTYGIQENSSGQLVVNVPWTNTTYTGGTGINISGSTVSLAAYGTAGSAGPTSNSSVDFGGSINIPQVTTDAYGRTTLQNRTITLPTAPSSPTNYVNTTGNQTGIAGNKTWTGDHTFTGNQTIFQSDDWTSGRETDVVKYRFKTGSNQYGAIYFGKEGSNSGAMIGLDQVEGTRRLNFRASSTAGAIVWSQPEANSQVFFDVNTVNFRTAGYVFNASGITPSSTNTRNTGSSSKLFKTLYANTLSNGSASINIADIANKSSIPTVNNGALTINVGATAKTFTANSSTNTTVDIPLYTSGTGISVASSGNSRAISLTNTGVSASTYGNTSASIAHGSGFTIPRITVDAQGRITSASNSTITLPANTDTKNTAGATNSDSKLFLIGATSQSANPQTYSDSEVYTTNGTLTTKTIQIGGGSASLQYNSSTASIDFIFE